MIIIGLDGCVSSRPASVRHIAPWFVAGFDAIASVLCVELGKPSGASFANNSQEMLRCAVEGQTQRKNPLVVCDAPVGVCAMYMRENYTFEYTKPTVAHLFSKHIQNTSHTPREKHPTVHGKKYAEDPIAHDSLHV